MKTIQYALQFNREREECRLCSFDDAHSGPDLEKLAGRLYVQALSGDPMEFE
jgi:hypothetical protein